MVIDPDAAAVSAAASRPSWWRRARRSTRVRTVALLVSLVLAALAVSILVSRAVLLDRLDQRIDRQLRNQAAELTALASDGVDSATGRPFTDVSALMRTQITRTVPDPNVTLLAVVDDRVDARSAQPPPYRLDTDPALVARFAATTAPTLASADTPRGQVRFAAVPVAVGDGGADDGVFVVAAFRDLEAADIDDTVRVLALVGLIAAAVTAAIAWYVIGWTLRPLRSLAATARRVDDRELGARAVATGTSDLDGVARAFNAMLDRLEHAFTEQRRFADDAGHELRTPLTIVRGHTELMSDDPEVRAEQRAVVLDELDRMGRMVDDLLTLTRSGQPDFVHLEDTDLAALTDELWVKARSLGDHDWQLEHRAEGVATLDRHRITQAVLQLAQNATQHTPPGGRIGLGLATDHGELRVWLHDSGAGVRAEDRESVFARFTRGSDARRSGPGAGLGLSIVRAIAEAHDGTVEFEDPPDGVGAKVVLVVPVRGEGAHS